MRTDEVYDVPGNCPVRDFGSMLGTPAQNLELVLLCTCDESAGAEVATDASMEATMWPARTFLGIAAGPSMEPTIRPCRLVPE